MGKVTIEKTELYVDDIDYDDRPRTNNISSSASSRGHTSTSSQKPQQPPIPPNLGFNIGNDEMKFFDEIFNDAKTKETMKQFTEALSGFKDGDEAKLMENFGRVMSQLTSEDLEGDDDEDDDENFELDKLEGLSFFKDLKIAASNQKESSQKKSPTDLVDSANNSSELKEEKSQMTKVLEDMTKKSDEVLNNSNDNAFAFSSLFSKLTSSLDDGANEGEDLDGASAMMMEPILSMLFSKDILYPSLKLMLENYDKYIEERRDKLSEVELKKCNDQKECIAEMCTIYEGTKDEDSKEVKSENLRKILDLLEKCGVFLLICLFLNLNVSSLINVIIFYLDATV
jgi:hypothetical protein